MTKVYSFPTSEEDPKMIITKMTKVNPLGEEIKDEE
jgi:hypothetical protein